MVVPMVNYHLIGPQEAKNITDVGETKGPHYLSSPHLSQTVGSRVTRVHCQWLLQCHLGLTGWTDPDIPEEVDSIERMELR